MINVYSMSLKVNFASIRLRVGNRNTKNAWIKQIMNGNIMHILIDVNAS